MAQMIGLVFLLLCGWAMAELELYEDNPIQNPSGIYFESMGYAHRIKGHWEIITRIEMRDLYRQVESITAMATKYLHNCNLVANDCDEKLRPSDWIALDKRARGWWNKLKDYLRPLDTPQDTKGYSKYQSYLTEKEEERYGKAIPNSSIKRFKERAPKISHIISGIQSTIMTLDNERQLASSLYQKITELTPGSEEVKNQYSNLTATLTRIGELRLELFETTLNVVMQAKNGLIHPFLFGTERLRKLFVELKSEKEFGEFPFLNQGIGLSQLKDIMVSRLFMRNGRLTFSFQLPLVDTTKYLYYALHPHPVFQRIGNQTNVTAFIRPAADYLFISEDKSQYAYGTQETFKMNCGRSNGTVLCNSLPPLFSTVGELPCEVIAILNRTMTGCDIRISKTYHDIWIPLLRTGEWIYALKNSLVTKLQCPRYPHIEFLLKGNGHLKLGEGCVLITGAVQLSNGNIPQGNPAIPDYSPDQSLDILTAFPFMEYYERHDLFDSYLNSLNEIPVSVFSYTLGSHEPPTILKIIRDVSKVWKLIIICSFVTTVLTVNGVIGYCIRKHYYEDEPQRELAHDSNAYTNAATRSLPTPRERNSIGIHDEQKPLITIEPRCGAAHYFPVYRGHRTGCQNCGRNFQVTASSEQLTESYYSLPRSPRPVTQIFVPSPSNPTEM